MKILALDAATEACSAAIHEDGENCERFEIAPREHANRLLPMAHELLAEAQWRLHDLDAIAVGRGPGAFTGLRIATGIAQGLALGGNVPVTPVSDLAALAAGTARACNAEQVLTVADARMHEVYWCAFKAAGHDNGPVAMIDERVSAPHAIPPMSYDETWLPAGNGWAAYEHELASLRERVSATIQVQYPRAMDIACLGAAMARRGDSVRCEHALPSYVRDDVARKPG